MSYLENLGVEALIKRAQRYMRDSVVREIKTHVTDELERHMSQLTDSLDRLSTNISNELDQVRAGLQQTIDDLQSENSTLASDKEALVAALQEQVDNVGTAQAKVDSLNTDLEANDPQPGEPDPEA